MLSGCSPKHRPAYFTVSNNLLFLMLSSHSKTFTSALGPCFPKHRPAHLTVSNNSFYPDVKQPFKSVQFYSRAVLSQAWPSSYHGVKHIIHLGVYAQVALPQTWPTSSHGVKQSFYLDPKQVLKNSHFYAWAVVPHFPKHDPAHFTVSNIASSCSETAV